VSCLKTFVSTDVMLCYIPDGDIGRDGENALLGLTAFLGLTTRGGSGSGENKFLDCTLGEI